jgi:F-type H+-transporting ATPase subunit epsilon
VTLRVELVVPDRELWAGDAQTVVAKTTEGDIGVLTGHSPVFGILAEGSLVEIYPPEGAEDQAITRAAVSGGFLSVADNQVSILAAEAQLSEDVDVTSARQELDAAETNATPGQSGGDESAEAKYARARLRAAGQQA